MVSRLVAFLLIPILLYLAWVAGSWGLADVYARPAINEIKRWQENKKNLELKDWERLRIELEKALRLDPDNPDTNHFMALALEGGYADYPPRAVVAQASRRIALDYYRKAVRLRPVWPYTWIDLALVKYRLGELDTEFYKAWHQGVELGPWESSVQKVAASIGLHGWNVLTREDHVFTLEVIRKGVHHADTGHAQAILEQVRSYGLLELVCLIMEEDKPVQEYCQRHRKK